MSCIKCTRKSDHVFCWVHCPLYGETVSIKHKKLTIFVGRIPLFEVIVFLLKGHKCIKWWMGTDALTMWYFPPGKSKIKIILHRIKMWLIGPLVAHWVTGERLLYDLPSQTRNRARIKYWPSKYQTKVEKKAHKGFNVLYYNPPNSTFNRWKYGLDLIEEIKQRVDGVNWMAVDGSQDMNKIYAITDLYIRPSRHDGEPRMNIECQLNDIPMVYSYDENEASSLRVLNIKDMVNHINMERDFPLSYG